MAEENNDLYLKVGKIEANIETYHGDTKKALDLITGNGRPEDGILYIMTDIRKGVKTLNEWTEKHVCETHKDIETRVRNLEDANKNVFMQIWAWCKEKPAIAIPLALAILSGFGFSADKIINMLIMVREIGEKLGVK